MTISNTTSSVTVQGNGLTTTFSYDFYMGGSSAYASLVLTNAAGTTSTITASLFSITAVTDPDGGTFTYPLVGSPITAGESLTLYRILPIVQNAAIANQGNFYPSVVENEFDYITMILQQQQTQIVTASNTASDALTLAEGALQKTANLSDLTTVSDARTNLGLGALATLSSVATTYIDNSAVTLAKMANMSNGRFLGNFSGNSAAPQEVQLAAGSNVIITTASGVVTIAALTTGTGFVVGPTSSTDNAIARFDGTTGVLLNTSLPTVTDDGRIATLTDPTDLTDAATKGYTDELVAGLNLGGAAQNTFLTGGGQVVWISGLTFSVSAATYYIGGVLYTSSQQSIVLDAADPSNPRIDVIAVDSTGTVVKVTGTAASEPSSPDVDPGTQLQLSIVLIPALATEPAGITSTLFYAEDVGSPTEWNWTSSGSGWTLNSTVDPMSGTKCIAAVAVASGSYIQGQIGSGTINPANYDLLVLYLKSTSTWANNRGLQVSWRQSGVVRGVAVPINRTGSFGFQSNNTSIYQQVAIPMSLFAITSGQLVDQLRLQVFGGAINFRGDNFSAQGGATEQQPGGGGTVTSVGTGSGLTGGPITTSGTISLASIANQRFMGNYSGASAAPVAMALSAGGGITFSANTTSLTLSTTMSLTGAVTGTGSASITTSQIGTLNFIIDGGGSTITTGIAGPLGPFDFAMTLGAWTATADQTGSITVSLWSDTYANYPPTVADSIVGSTPIAITSSNKATTATLVGWTTSIPSGNVVLVNVDSVATVQRVGIALKYTR